MDIQRQGEPQSDHARAPVAVDAPVTEDDGSSTLGTPRDALANPEFRRIYIASFISNTGRWMQTAALGVLAWELTGSYAFLGQLIFFQLIPMSVLSLVGGALADTIDRRKLLLGTQIWQMVTTLILAGIVATGDVTRSTLAALVFLIGLGQGFFAPAFTSILPSLVGRENLTAAVSLNSVQTNGARVIGPALGGYLTSKVGFGEVFAINGVSYMVVIAALWAATIPAPTGSRSSLSDRILGGFIVARRHRQIGLPLLTMTTFSFLCLPFIGQMPAIAEELLGIESRSVQYGYFYAAFGLGALIGAGLVGTVLLHAPKSLTTRVNLAGFAIALAFLAINRSTGLGYLLIFLVGLFYFAIPTTLSSFWQEHVADSVRGRVAALWVLAFGGTIPVANLIAGPVIEATSLTAVVLGGAIAAAVLAVAVRLTPGAVVGEEILQPR